MTELEYGNRSINSLVEELNSLGNRSVLVHHTELIAIQTGENKNVRRFQSKSCPKKQFFKCHQNDKKYFYSNVFSQIDENSLSQFMANWQKGYNCTILVQNNRQQYLKLVNSISRWTKNCLLHCLVLNKQNILCDLLSQASITHRELLQNKKYYQLNQTNKSKLIPEYLSIAYQGDKSGDSNTLIDLTFKDPQTCAELHLTAIPSEMFKPETNPPFSLIKTQFIQLLNYIKMNPNKRYEHISKLITKRLPMTNYLAKILMSDSCNLLVNFIAPQSYQEPDSVGKFQLFDKISLLANLLSKPTRHLLEIGLLKPLQMKSANEVSNNQNRNPLSLTRAQLSRCKKQANSQANIVSPIAMLNLKTQNDPELQETISNQMQKSLEQKQFEFCRSLERKTHKYSISPREETLQDQGKETEKQNNLTKSDRVNYFLDKKTISKYNPTSEQNQFKGVQIQKFNRSTPQHPYPFKSERDLAVVSQSEQILLLKAQHTREISQYHQTIQLLNKKILLLTKQLNLEELYKIHEREIMLLELKIRELREDILTLTKDEPNQNTIKATVKRLTQQIKAYENTSTAKKLSQGRIFMLEKELKQTKVKLSASQKARSTLTLEIEALTKRLKIRDSELQKINQEDIQKYQCEDLSLTEEQVLEDIKKLLKAVRNQQRNSAQFLLRKFSNILSDLSKSRDIILQCNDFLVQLMEILDLKLSSKSPQIVLDCNKFIRSFLLENLSIF